MAMDLAITWSMVVDQMSMTPSVVRLGAKNMGSWEAVGTQAHLGGLGFGSRLLVLIEAMRVLGSTSILFHSASIH